MQKKRLRNLHQNRSASSGTSSTRLTHSLVSRPAGADMADKEEPNSFVAGGSEKSGKPPEASMGREK